jgi:hypothetical protein
MIGMSEVANNVEIDPRSALKTFRSKSACRCPE